MNQRKHSNRRNGSPVQGNGYRGFEGLYFKILTQAGNEAVFPQEYRAKNGEEKYQILRKRLIKRGQDEDPDLLQIIAIAWIKDDDGYFSIDDYGCETIKFNGACAVLNINPNVIRKRIFEEPANIEDILEEASSKYAKTTSKKK